MDRIEKTVFLSYRRTNIPWALAIYQSLTHHGYDVFFDYNGIASGDFEQVILGNIAARAHFIVLLTPSALERCQDPGDWLRREIEAALASQRNIVPIMLESFDFAAPGIVNQLTGTLAGLRNYNGLRVPPDYFDAGMERLRTKFLNVPLTAVLHRASASALQAAYEQKALANAAPAVQETELTAQQWFERGLAATDSDEKLRCYNEAVRLNPDYAVAFTFRGNARKAKGDLDGAMQDYNEAIRIEPDYLYALTCRGDARKANGDLDGAMRDYDEAIRFKPDYVYALTCRGVVRKAKGDLDRAMRDYDEAIRLEPDSDYALMSRGLAREAKGDLDGAMKDFDEVIRLRPDHAVAFFNRGIAHHKSASSSGEKPKYKAAIADYQKYLHLGGGMRDGRQSEIEQVIRDLEQKL
jgi:tetratricopeptide (TPR) repeat protein